MKYWNEIRKAATAFSNDGATYKMRELELEVFEGYCGVLTLFYRVSEVHEVEW